MDEIKIPPIGTRVEVQTSSPIAWQNFPKPPIIGIVSYSNPWDKPGTFRLTHREDVFGTIHFESTITIERVKYLKILGTARDPENPDSANIPDLQKAKAVEVKGSKDNVYIVMLDRDKSSCTCPAGSRGRPCKHIKIARDQEEAA